MIVMLYLDDRLPRHPKILRAGARLGNGGAGRALSLFLDGLAYAREQLTDGHIPMEFVATTPLVCEPESVADALVGVKLWHRTRAGFRIHDFHDWNKSASEVKRQRRHWREKKRRQRKNTGGRFSEESRGDTRESTAETRARVRDPMIHDPLKLGRTLKPLSKDPGTCTASVLTGRFASGSHTARRKKTPTHRVLCAMVRAEIDVDPDATYGDWIEGVKLRLVRQGFAYPAGDALTAAIDAVDVARGRWRQRA